MVQKKVDVEHLIEMVKANPKATTFELAKPFGASRARMSQILLDLVDKGTIPFRGYGRRNKSKERRSPSYEPTFDDAAKFFTECVKAYWRLPEVEAELRKYKAGYENMKDMFEQEHKGEQKRKEQEREFQLATKQGVFGGKR